jgi:hypothetical protein
MKDLELAPQMAGCPMFRALCETWDDGSGAKPLV